MLQPVVNITAAANKPICAPRTLGLQYGRSLIFQLPELYYYFFTNSICRFLKLCLRRGQASLSRSRSRGPVKTLILFHGFTPIVWVSRIGVRL